MEFLPNFLALYYLFVFFTINLVQSFPRRHRPCRCACHHRLRRHCLTQARCNTAVDEVHAHVTLICPDDHPLTTGRAVRRALYGIDTWGQTNKGVVSLAVGGGSGGAG